MRGSKTDPDRVSSLVVLVSIIQTGPLLEFNGPSANVLSGQREPRVLRHFNGCNDERMKSERRDRVSLAGTTQERGQVGRQVRGLEGGGRWSHWAGMRPGDDAGRKGEGGRGVSGLLGCHCLLVANIDDALTSLTFGWVLTAAGLVYSRSLTNTEHQNQHQELSHLRGRLSFL